MNLTVSRFILIRKKSYAEIILTNEIPPRCDIPSRRVTIMSSRRVITSWRHTSLDVISHCNFDFVGRDMMTGWHIITRRDGILHQGGISLGCNMSTWQKNDKYRPSTDCSSLDFVVEDKKLYPQGHRSSKRKSLIRTWQKREFWR